MTNFWASGTCQERRTGMPDMLTGYEAKDLEEEWHRARYSSTHLGFIQVVRGKV